MPDKRRRSRQRKRGLAKPVGVQGEAGSSHISLTPSVDTAQTPVCSVCHRAGRPSFTCSIHRVCDLCMEVTDTSGVNSLRCPLCPVDSWSTRGGVVIGKVKNLWLGAATDRRVKCSTQLCSVHDTQTLEFWCKKCDVLICSFCKLSEHEGHESKSLKLLLADAQQRLDHARCTRLQEFEDRLHTALKETKNRVQKFRQMQEKAAKAIHHRHAQLLDVTEKYRDSALHELDAVARDVESWLEEDETRLRNEMKTLSDLQIRIDQTSGCNADPQSVLSLDREIEEKWNIDSIRARRSAACPSYDYTLEQSASEEVVHLKASTGLIPQMERLVDHFIGHPVVKKTHLPKMPVDVKVTLMFRCCENPAAYVLSVCPTGAEKLAVSYTTSPDLQEGVTKSFFEDGRPSKSFEFGLCTLISEGNGKFGPFRYGPQKLFFNTDAHCMVSKSGSKQVLCCLDNSFVLGSYFRLPSPFSRIWGRGLPRAMVCFHWDAVAPLNFDATRNRDVFAVVDMVDGRAPSLDNLRTYNRVVKVISISEDHYFTDVYEPPDPHFVPSDVCFFCLGGHTVLLVSDLANNSIHVLSILPFCVNKLKFVKCQFQRYLVADCEMLQHPTALNTDEQGKLWVACQGGQLLTVDLVL